jgi:putative flavoprotein involved in K+ transport
VSITADEVRFQDETAVRAATVVWATGFRADLSWIDVPEALDAEGRPRHERGISAVRGLAFVGLPWQFTRGSALLGFVRQDAAWVAAQLSAQRNLQIDEPLVRPDR